MGLTQTHRNRPSWVTQPLRAQFRNCFKPKLHFLFCFFCLYSFAFYTPCMLPAPPSCIIFILLIFLTSFKIFLHFLLKSLCDLVPGILKYFDLHDLFFIFALIFLEFDLMHFKCFFYSVISLVNFASLHCIALKILTSCILFDNLF
jgi:hypothetical protein